MHAQMTSSTVKAKTLPRKDKQEILYEKLLKDIQKRVSTAVETSQHLFTTDTSEGIWDRFMENLYGDDRQHYSCNSCRKFIERYGHLATIDERGIPLPLVWLPTSEYGILDEPVMELYKMVTKAKVTGVFLSDQKIWGEPKTGPWLHMAAKLKSVPFKQIGLKTVEQTIAEKLEDFGMLGRAVADFTLNQASQAIELLSSDVLYRSEKVLGVAKFFHGVLFNSGQFKGKRRTNLLWRAVAMAPIGFCHIRTSMIGTLLEDLAAGLSGTEVAKKFAAKMNPLAYQRPQAAPKAGNIAQAEKIFEQLGLARSLKRRYCNLEDLPLIWSPTPETYPSEPGLFGHLKIKELPTRTNATVQTPMTWVKFRDQILPGAKSIEVHCSGFMPFAGLVMAEDPAAPEILRWPGSTSWYFRSGGAAPYDFNLENGWVKCTGIAKGPDEAGFAANPRAFLILDGCKDRTSMHDGLFPENLKSELREVRSVMEANSRSNKPSNENPTGQGIGLHSGMASQKIRIRVSSDSVTTEYLIDRWD